MPVTSDTTYTLSSLVQGELDGPSGTVSGQLAAYFYDAQGNLLEIIPAWTVTDYAQPDTPVLQEGTVSHDTAVQMRVGMGTAVDAGWLSYENVNLRATSESLPVIGGERYQLTAQIDAQLTMPDSARLLLVTTDGNQTRTETLWTNEAGSPNGIVTITYEFYATAGAGIMQVVVEMPLDGGTLTLSDLSLGLYVPPPVTQRSTYSLAGQAVAVRVTSNPAAESDGRFYLYSDHLGSASAMTDAAGNLVGNVTRYLPFGGYRTGSGPNEVTDRGFTGQRENMSLGLYYYQARYYGSSTNSVLKT